MPVRAWAQRARRPLGALLVVASVASVALTAVYSRRARAKAEPVCHPNLSHLRHAEDDREVLLIGTLPLDLDGNSQRLVTSSLEALKPDVVMVEGTWTAGLNAMFFSGTWELHGIKPPKDLNWTDIGDAAPVELVKPKVKRGWFGLGGAGSHMPIPRLPDRSLVPLKVGNWAHHLRGSVGSDIAAAVASAAAAGVPVRFLGPADGGLQGHFLVSMLARQAAMELLQEEHQRGSQMPNSDVDAALVRAEGHVRQDSKRWLRDMRGEHTRSMERVEEHLRSRVPAKVREEVTEQAEERIAGTASRISDAMEAFRKGAVVLAVDQLVGVERQLKQAGYSFVSECA